MDGDGNQSTVAKVNIHIASDQPDFKIMMNYELGMHCTGFEFSYCCVLPPYNSILAQVVKPQNGSYPEHQRGLSAAADGRSEQRSGRAGPRDGAARLRQ